MNLFDRVLFRYARYTEPHITCYGLYMTASKKIVYKIECAEGFHRNMVIKAHDGHHIYHLKSPMISMKGWEYSVIDDSGHEVLAIKQDHTLLLPRYSILDKENIVARIGHCIIPWRYYIQLANAPRMKVNPGWGIHRSSFCLTTNEQNVIACIKNEMREKGLSVEMSMEHINHLYILAALTMIYFEMRKAD